VNLKNFFNKAACVIAANLDKIGMEQMTMGFDGMGEWYEYNGHFKFPVGKKIDCKSPRIFGYGLNPLGWEVKGYTKDSRGADTYIIKNDKGEEQLHFKWNIENQFKPANPKAKPFNPKRFTRD